MFERKTGSKNGGKPLICVAIIAGMMLFSVSLFSALYVASEAHHDCCGEGCPICAHIDQCEAMLRNTGDGEVSPSLSFLFAVIASAYERIFCLSSLVTCKVRMNN